MINNRKSPIQDDYIEKYLAEKELNLTATLDAKAAYSDADFVVIAAPTNYDSHTQHFDTSAVEAVIKLVIRALSLSVLHCLFQATGQWLCAELIQPTPKSPKHRLFDRKALFLPLFRRKPLYFFFSCKELVTKVPPDLCRYRRITFRRHSLHELSSQMRPTAAACDMRDLVISGIAIGMVATGILLNRLFGFRFIFLLCLVKQTKLLLKFV